MPELPEVETIKNDLLPRIVGCHVTSIILLWAGVVRKPSPEEFHHRLLGQAIEGISRRGKYLTLWLSSGEALIFHFRMTGSLLLTLSSNEPGRFTRAIFSLDNGKELRFEDPRKLGMMWLVKDESEVIGKLGPEPFDLSFTPKIMAERLSKRSGPIKAVLLDQNFLAGVGNMYADEALFDARINPLKISKNLCPVEVERLHTSIRHVLRWAIGDGGASVDTYQRLDGEPGKAQFRFRVAHRGGEPCPICGTPIERIPIRNRGSYFCPQCQPMAGLS